MAITQHILAAALAGLFSLPALAITADRETANIGSSGDADDPAIWLHPTDPTKSLVIGAVKNAGARVYNLGAVEVQVINPFTVGSGASRINNVDVQYGFRLNDGSRIDIAVGSDRGQDVFRVWKIDGDNSSSPLSYVGVDNPTRAFLDKPNGADNPVSAQNTAYGLALYRDVAADRFYVLATQRSQARVAQFELVASADGKVDTRWVRDWDFATMTVGGAPVSLAGKQFEGMVVDQQTGMLYAGQEDVGIWRIDLKSGTADDRPFVLSSTYDAASPLKPDVEGLTLYYGASGSGYLLASSQGDNSFAVFDRQNANGYLGSFAVAAGGVDSVQESDGADVVSLALPGYPQGLFITQDGDNDPENGTNFKYASWGDIASEMNLLVNTTAYDPRNPLAAVPEPETRVLMLAGLALAGCLARRRRSAAHEAA